jgi:hypothetical protein
MMYGAGATFDSAAKRRRAQLDFTNFVDVALIPLLGHKNDINMLTLISSTSS